MGQAVPEPNEIGKRLFGMPEDLNELSEEELLKACGHWRGTVEVLLKLDDKERILRELIKRKEKMMERPSKPPLLKGGQGRDEDDTYASMAMLTYSLLTMAAFGLVALAVWIFS